MKIALAVAIAGVAALTACAEHGSGGGGGGPGQMCEGVLCAADEFCDFSRNGCGLLNADVGTCRARPTSCDDSLEPTCGCDGVIHANPCTANEQGVDLAAAGGCPVPVGEFECGFRQCSLVEQFCQRSFSDVGFEPDGFQCLTFPACPAGLQNCTCLAGEACGGQCMSLESGGFELQCLGG